MDVMRLGMEYRKAVKGDAGCVFELIQSTIKTVYPRYYPQKIVNFFCELHKKENIIDDIQNGYVYILLCDNSIVGTGTHTGNHITRVFVAPEWQGLGYGSYIMRRLEREISLIDTAVYLDASLAASIFYEHRGYKTVKHARMAVDNEVLVYEIMKKELQANRNIKSITDFIFVEDEPQKSDAIMVVGGSYPEAAEIAADLWKQGYAPKIMIGGGVSIKTGRFPGSRSKQDIYNKAYADECEFYTDVLLKNGVDKNAIYGENKSSFTKENALYAKKLAEERKLTVHKAILICKSFHARRCLMFYQMVFPSTDFYVKTFDGFGINKNNWYLSEYGIQRVLGELKRCGEQINPDELEKLKL